MVLEEVQGRIENELENEGLNTEDIVDYEVEMDLGEVCHNQGIIDTFEVMIDKKDRIVRVMMELY